MAVDREGMSIRAAGLLRATRSLRATAAACGASACLALNAAAQEAGRLFPPIDAASHADWSGPYLGLSAGAGSNYGRYRTSPFMLGPDMVAGLSGTFTAAGSATPWNAGGFAGYLWQAGPIVYGVEGRIGTTSTKRSLAFDGTADSLTAKQSLGGGLRGRLGYAFDNYLFYGTAGLAFGRHRFVAASPFLTTRDTSDDLGFSYGFGIETAITPTLALGIDYQRIRFSRNGTPFTSVPRARLDSDEVAARLTWRPFGMALAPEPKEEEGQPSDWSIHGQTTYIQQATPRFRSPYTGQNSFLPTQSRQTWTLSGFFGRRLWEGGELYFNPELNQGYGLSNTLGIAGYVNGEAQKAGASYPKFRAQRYFFRQTFGLGGETETVEDGPSQIAGTRDIDRITFTIGKIAVGDIFDDNAYAHDPRANFNNWGLWASGAYDFPANLPGLTQGAVAELNRKDWAVRAGLFQVPKEPNSDVLDPRITQKGGAVVEFEQRFSLFDQPGKLRIGAFTNVGRTADYRTALVTADILGLPDPNDAALLTRRDRRKSGFYVNLEKAITDDLGLFARASWNDGRSEILSFTDIDRSLSGGFALKGTMWNRPKDTVGIGATYNAISNAHRDYLAAGGLGLLLGDGRLSYAPEHALEAYYKLNLAGSVDVTFDYQLVARPGYNADRGPVNLFAARLHAEF